MNAAAHLKRVPTLLRLRAHPGHSSSAFPAVSVFAANPSIAASSSPLLCNNKTNAINSWNTPQRWMSTSGSKVEVTKSSPSIKKKPKPPPPEFSYTPLFDAAPDTTTEYRQILPPSSVETVSLPDGTSMLRVPGEALRTLSSTAFSDVAHLLRPAHLAQLRKILDDPEASDNDRFVAMELLKNANIASGRILPGCQDTGTAIIMGKRGHLVLTDGDDDEYLSHGAYDAYTKLNLRYSQVAPLSMFEEKNTGTNLPAQVDVLGIKGDEYHFLFIAKGGGSANKTFLYQQTKALLNTGSLETFLEEKIKSIGTSACPPYHLAVVIGGLSAEQNLKTVKLASTKYYDTLPTSGDPNASGRAFRDVEWENHILEMTRNLGIGAQFGGKYFCHDIRVVRLPRHGASCPVGIGVSCSADRQVKGKITKEGVFIEKLETNVSKPDETGRNVFEGVLALDYKFTDIGKFLGSSYEESDTVIVAIVEEASPHYVIATSTGGIGAKTVLASDNAQPCETDSPGCVSVRIMSSELDNAISEAFAVQIEAGFPETDLLPAVFDDVVYATQTKPFSLPSDGVNWRIMILSPIETLSQDAIEHNDSLVAFIIAPSILGFIVCAIFFVLFMMKRKTREVINSDYRFTGAFILNCCLLNLACLSFMGGNTDELCLLRMWLVHFFFVVTLAPLLVKTYRMYMLVGKPGLRRHKISHVKTALMMVPFILIEVAILLIFTFVDPSKETSLIEQDASTVTYRVVCTHETIAFATVQLAYEGAILLVGCFLAYKTRNMKDDFGECKQLLLAMYNIALIASIIIVLAYVAELYGKLRILVTVGVCWSTIFSSGVFVLPRLLQVQQSSSTASRSHPSSFDRRGSVSDIRERLAIRESNPSSQQTIGLDSVKEAEAEEAKPGKESEKEMQECETISGP